MICVVPGYIHTAFTEGYIWKFQGAREAGGGGGGGKLCKGKYDFQRGGVKGGWS